MDRFKIINKSKEGVLIRLPKGKTLKISWDEFKSNWIQVEDRMAEMKPEYKAKLDQIDSKLDMLTIQVRRNQVIELNISKGIATADDKGDQLALWYSIGTLTEELSKLLNCTIAEVLQLVGQRLQLLMDFSTPDFRKKYDKKYKDPSESTTVPQSAKTTLGDHPEFEKLKNLFK